MRGRDVKGQWMKATRWAAWTQWFVGNRPRVRRALLLGAMVLALVGGVFVSLAGRPQAAHAAATVVRDTDINWAGNIAIGGGYQWASAEWTVPQITDSSAVADKQKSPCWA